MEQEAPAASRPLQLSVSEKSSANCPENLGLPTNVLLCEELVKTAVSAAGTPILVLKLSAGGESEISVLK
jgi:hypothetical protein